MPIRCGLVSAWWTKTLKELSATFNARAESVTEKRCGGIPGGDGRIAFRYHRQNQGPQGRGVSRQLRAPPPPYPGIEPTLEPLIRGCRAELARVEARILELQPAAPACAPAASAPPSET